MRKILSLALALLLLASTTVLAVRAEAADTAAQDAGYGAAAVFSTLLYAPLKTSFCILGGVASVFTLPFGTSTAGKVATASCGGTWMITPDTLKGKEPVRFVGEPRR